MFWRFVCGVRKVAGLRAFSYSLKDCGLSKLSYGITPFHQCPRVRRRLGSRARGRADFSARRVGRRVE